MNKVIIDKMILSAMDILEENTLGILEKDKKIQSKYYGYIAAFGPSLMQTGLIQCIAFYSKTQTKEDKDRKKIIQLMEETLERTGRIKKAEHEKNVSYSNFMVEKQYHKSSMPTRSIECFHSHLIFLNFIPKKCLY
ncbi:CRISPR-associated Cmr5 family protein [Candidatus Magnetomorum sp. HK-1]|nr:CRISPR-associated Cmr5 family protein [Candidatus Magnetomorum sp. HK-1]